MRRRILLGTLLVSGIAPACSAPAPAGFNPPRGTAMTTPIDDARELLLQYEKSHDPLLLQRAGEKLESVDLLPVQGSDERTAARLQTLQAWLAILVRVDLAKDPSFTGDDPPATKVSPPTTPGGPAYLPGVDPKQVRDPKVRADYERAIEQNRQKAAQSQRQWQWKALDIEVSEGAARFVKRYYSASPPDQQELRAEMEKTALSKERQRKLAKP